MSTSARRLAEAAQQAGRARAAGDDWAAAAAWRRHRLISDAARDPDELLAEGLALSVSAMEIAQEAARPE